MLDASKVYDFTIAFGTQTSGLDAEGAVVATSDARPILADILAVLPHFTGPIDQVPPAYSALKIDGERAYDRARRGEDVVMVARAVTVFSLAPACEGAGQAASNSLASSALESITLTAHVSKGTYIRSLARDIALACGTVGHVSMLRRTRAGPFGVNMAISLDKLTDAAKARRPLKRCFCH